MKKDIHPVYHNDAVIKCACGNVIVTGSINKEMKTDICSACHPFYTGKQKLVDSAGRVDKFLAKQKLAVERAESAKQAQEERKSGKKGEKYMTIEEIKAIKEKNQPKHEKTAEKEPEIKESDTSISAEQGEMLFEERKTEEPTAEAKKTEAKPAAIKKPVVKKAAVKKVAVKKPVVKKAAVKKVAPAKAKKAAPKKTAKKPVKKGSK
jgi:large subunit ribosomal protein L31